MKNHRSPGTQARQSFPSPQRNSRRVFSLAKCLGLGLGAAVAGLAAQSAKADAIWTGAADNNFNNTANYNGAPASNQNVIINVSTGNFPVLNTNQAIATQDIIIGSNGSGRFDQTAGGAGTGANNWLFIGQGNGNVGTYNLANTSATGGSFTGFGTGSGSFDVGGTTQNGRLLLGNGGDAGTLGTLNMNTTGTLNAKQDLGFLIGTNGGSGTVNFDNGTINTARAWFGDNSGASTGTLRMSGGTFNASNTTEFGRGGGTGNATITGGAYNQTGGEFWAGSNSASTINQSGGVVTTTSYFVVARDAGSNGTYNLSGGTVNASQNGGGTSIGASGGATGLLNVSGGTFNAATGGIIVGEGFQGTGTASGTLTISGSGVVALGANNYLSLGLQAIGNGTLNLNGGTFQANGIARGAGTGTVNFNGGTFQVTAGTTTAPSGFMSGLTAANVLAGGAKFDTNSFNVTVGQALVHGGAGTDGGLIKSGAGQLELTAANTFNGATNIQAGTLLLSTGTVASTAASVSSGGALTLGNNNANNNALPDNLTLSLVSGATFNLNAAGGTETIMTLLINGSAITPGVYSASALNGMGGVTFTSGFNETLTVTAVPEPSTWAAGLLGLGFLGYSQRRRVRSWLQCARVA